jgi:WD40 repeat protein
MIQKGHSGIIYSIAFSKNGSIIASGGEDKTIKLWDVKSGKLIKTFSANSCTIYSIAFSPNNNFILASASYSIFENEGEVKSTRSHRPWRLVAVQEVESRAKATWIEKQLKHSHGTRLRWMKRYGV